MRALWMGVCGMLAATATAAAAQQSPDQVGTVPQARFETAPPDGSETAPPDGSEPLTQPRFVRAPGADGIETSPLAPPGGAAPDPAAAPQDGTSGSTERQARFKTPAPSSGIRIGGDAVPIDAPPTDLRQGVRLRELDKMTGQTETFELAVGETRQVDRLRVRLDACRSPQGNDTHGTMAFLKVWDARTPETEAFSGWMFAESPSLSAIDHPRYDLWVISCTTSALAVSSDSE